MRASRRSVINTLVALALASVAAAGWAAQVAATIVNLSGPLMARKANGAVKALSVKSEVEQGDTLVAEKNTYAQLRFVDNSEITLKPGTTFRVEAFSYEAGKPDSDSASFTLVKGGLRSVTGLLGKRNKERFQLRTPTATIGIRGTTFTVDYFGAAGSVMPPQTMPGLYVSVIDGAIAVSNAGGSQQFAAGQFGFVRSSSIAPVIVPPVPALRFAPPPTFSARPGSGPVAAAVDCEVR